MTDPLPPTKGATSVPITVPTRKANKLRVYLSLGAIVCALAFVLARGLGDAAQFYRPVDEAIAKQGSIGSKRFSLIGVVVDGTVKERQTATGTQVSFVVEQNDAQMDVVHEGVPVELFRPGMPVLLDGHFEHRDGKLVFVSDRMAVKHSAEYKSKNPDRVQPSDQ